MPKSMRGRRRTSGRPVWIVVHCELMGPRDDPRTDEMIDHVASSVARVEKYFRRIFVSPYSWWMVERRIVDQPDFEADDRPERFYYNHRGERRLKGPPLAAAGRAFLRQCDVEEKAGVR